MRTLCDSCESAAAQYFCAADEAALCSNCDEKVHGCNKLANRHLRLQLRESWSVPRCDICESAPAFLHCSIDGSSLCLQCDMDVHVGGKRTHQRYLLLGQRVELPNGHHLRDEKGNPNAVDTARAWQNKYCQEHLHKVTPRHKSNDESDEQKD